jgi:clan AA aspartic protease (TIGR02281 family)
MLGSFTEDHGRQAIVRQIAVLVATLLGVASLANAQTVDGGSSEAKLIATWQASNAACRDRTTAALAAIAACEQRDTLSKRLAQLNHCYGQPDGTAPAAWRPCTDGGGSDAADAAADVKSLRDPFRARTTALFQRMGGVFVVQATVNGSFKTYAIVDSGATHVQIPEETVEEMRRGGSLSDADFLGQRRYTMADGRAVQQRVFRLRTLQIGDRAMENVTAAVGAPKSRPLLGQSFLRRLSWWKIDNVKNAIELEFTGSY